jgi:uncharacterized protein
MEVDVLAVRPAQTFVNVAVKDLNKTMEFFRQVGFEFNTQFTGENSACMILNENTFVMLLEEGMFQTFTKKELADPTKTTELILALSAGSKAEVDELVNKALAAGGKASNDPIDHGFMYGWSFQDIDGHLWEVFYMDESAINPA